jgi:hypothetical protein
LAVEGYNNDNRFRELSLDRRAQTFAGPGQHPLLSLFDQRNLPEISSPDFPGERLMACFNPLLAQERKRKRRELLDATEQALENISKQVKRRTSLSKNPPDRHKQ